MNSFTGGVALLLRHLSLLSCLLYLHFFYFFAFSPFRHPLTTRCEVFRSTQHANLSTNQSRRLGYQTNQRATPIGLFATPVGLLALANEAGR